MNDRDTHSVLDRKFAELHISELSPEPSPQEQRYKKMGLQPGVYERTVSNERESRAFAAQRDALLPKLVSGDVRVHS